MLAGWPGWLAGWLAWLAGWLAGWLAQSMCSLDSWKAVTT